MQVARYHARWIFLSSLACQTFGNADGSYDNLTLAVGICPTYTTAGYTAIYTAEEHPPPDDSYHEDRNSSLER